MREVYKKVWRVKYTWP